MSKDQISFISTKTNLLSPCPFTPLQDGDFFMGGYTDSSIQSLLSKINCVCNPESKCYNMNTCKQKLLSNVKEINDFFENNYLKYTETEKKNYEEILNNYNSIKDVQNQLNKKKDFISDPKGIEAPILYYPHVTDKQDKIYRRANIPDAKTAIYDDQEKIIKIQKQFYIASGILMTFLVVSAVAYPMMARNK